MASNLDLYRREIFNFLRTVTIKFEPFAYLMGESYMNAHGLTNPHGKWNPYYIHLAGEYTADELASDDVMHVSTIEHELPEDVIFSKDLKITNPKTAAIYKIPNDEYFHLEEQYPKHAGLLRCMVYPVSNIDEAIAAPNLTLLVYDDSLLEVNERESIVKCLKSFLDMVRTRWWIEEYTYEDMYAITFWGMLWQMLPMVLLGQRFRNIKTPYVHSFHVWEYLKSKGLNDYRDILTTRQALWLYRNIDYVLKNKGKSSNLRILAENLLEDASGNYYPSNSGLSQPDAKYYNIYTYSTSYTNHARGQLGDATREILKTVGSESGCWYSDSSVLPYSNLSWFMRGGDYSYGVYAGTFSFNRDTGGANSDYGFRSVLTAQ